MKSPVPPVQRIRKLLKVAGRELGLRCVAVSPGTRPTAEPKSPEAES